MSARFLLIDGYNLLHAAGMARARYGPGDLQRCRERLLRFLFAKLAPAELERVTVVFDARDPPPDRPSRQTFRGLTVQFANPGGDADVLIQEWLDAHSAPRHVTLVSSDKVLKRAARSHGSRSVDSEQFFKRLEHRRNDTVARSRAWHDEKPDGPLSAAEVDAWMKAFGDLPTHADVEEPAAPPAESSAGPHAPGKKPAARAGDTRSKRRKTQKPPTGKPGKKTASKELDYWAAMFGDIPEAAELYRGKGVDQAELEKWLSSLGERGTSVP